jgi:hypothetical protein
MTIPIFTLSLVRELRGSPLTVLVAILLLESSGQDPITAQLLKDVTGFGDHTITDSLHALSSPTRQLVVRVNGGWRISSGFQLPLEISTLSTVGVDNFPHRDIVPEGEASRRENREYRGFGIPSCSSSNRKDNKFNEILEEQEQEIIEIRDIRDSDTFRENYCLCLKLNIRDPKASELSALSHVTPDLIQAHVDQARSEGHPLGTAIYRIIHQWTPSLDEKATKKIAIEKFTSDLTGHQPGCNCTDCSMSRAGAPVCPKCHHIYQDCECKSEEEKDEQNP